MGKEYTCNASECGLVHHHNRGFAHDLTDLDSLDAEFIKQLEFDAQCHCGWHEAYVALQNNEIWLSEEDAKMVTQAATGGDGKWAHQLVIPENTRGEIYDEERNP